MKASDIRPAVINEIAAPRNGAGTSATMIRSLMAAKSTKTREKPTAAEKPNTVELNRVASGRRLFNKATPNTAQLLVISGKNVPNVL